MVVFNMLVLFILCFFILSILFYCTIKFKLFGHYSDLKYSNIIVCYHPVRFSSHRNSGSEDKIFLIHHVTSRDHMFKGLRDLVS